MPAPKAYTANELSNLLGADRRRIESVLTSLNIEPAKRRRRNAKLWHISKSAFEEVEAKLKATSWRAPQGELPLDLKEEKLKEEVEHLRLKNRKLRDEATPNRIVAEILGGLATFAAGLLTQKLEIENPVQTAGLEPAEIREINKKFNDEIRARFDSEFAKWAKYLDEERKEINEPT